MLLATNENGSHIALYAMMVFLITFLTILVTKRRGGGEDK